jgi:membrane-associated phospholipid phosphatase
MNWTDVINYPFLWIGVSLVLLIGYSYVPKKRRKIDLKVIFLVMAAAALGYGSSILFKELIAVPRPCFGLDLCPSTYSMPSTHATVAFSAMGTLGFLTTPWVLLLAVFQALSRVLEGVHTLADVSVGALLGLVIAGTIHKVYEPEFEMKKDGNKKSKGRNKNPRNR